METIEKKHSTGGLTTAGTTYYPSLIEKKSSSGAGGGLLLILLALIFIVAPMIVPASLVELQQSAKLLLIGFGVVMLIVGAIIITVAQLYRKTSADEAFVRTGVGGEKPIIDGGALVIPMVHNVIPVSLQTIRLKVERTGVSALITGDFLRADIIAEFYIRVMKDPNDVRTAATTLGEKAHNPRLLEDWVMDKLVNALRTVAATKTLEELNTKRKEFAGAVVEIVQADLKHNGLTLESVTISKLDQAPPEALKPESNVFDAQGAKRIAEITQTARMERNKIERQADQVVKKQDVERDQEVFKLELQRSQAEAERDKSIRVAQATAEQAAATVAAEQKRLASLAEVERDRAIQVAEVEKQKSIAVAAQNKDRAEQAAAIERERAIEVAEREKAIAVAEAERKRAAAQAEQLTAEKERESAHQAVVTVQVTQEAERAKLQKIIQQQAEAEKTRINRQVEADVQAYAKIKEAEGEQQAAEKRAEAQLKLADANKQARELEAEGDTAVQMVPVNVARQQVEVERAKVEVKREDLKNQSEFEKIARDLQIELARIQAQKEVGVQMAESFGVALSSAKMTIWGDPSTVARMTEAFFRGQSSGTFVDGLSTSVPPDLKDLAVSGVSGLGKLAAALVKKLTGQDIAPEEAEQALKEHLSGGDQTTKK
jgi:uncharacterized membrane protein YqiK